MDHRDSGEESSSHRVTWFGDRPVEGGTVFVHVDEDNVVVGGEDGHSPDF